MHEKPYVQTYSIVAGSLACNARCPFCVSKMTPPQGVGLKKPDVNWRNFDLGARLARDWGASIALITSKGESTLFPEQITQFMHRLGGHGFPMVELQTNGIKLAEESYDRHLKEWYDLGMTMVAVSMTHYDREKNKSIYQPDKAEGSDLDALIGKLHDVGFSVRLSNIMCKGYVDSVEELEGLADYAKRNKVEQLTVRPVEKPDRSGNMDVYNWVSDHYVPVETVEEMRDHLDANGTRLRELVHGAIIYDYKGQNICLSNCLTVDAIDNAIRQVIFFPDGHVGYDWQHEGAVLF